MIKGTVQSITRVFGADGKQALESKIGDKVQGNNLFVDDKTVLTAYIRNGVVQNIKYPAYIAKTAVVWDSIVDTPPPPPPIPTDRPQLYFIKHDWELQGWRGRNPYKAPEVHYLDHYTKLTPAWQNFWFNLNRPSEFSDSYNKTQFAKYTASNAFITDYKGSDLLADYINGTNLDKPPMEIKCLFCGGNVVTGFDDGIYLYPSFLNGMDNPPAPITYKTHPWFIHQATIISIDLPDGKRQINPFVNFGGRNTGIPVYHPFMGNPQKLVKYPLHWVRKLGADEAIPNPYNPSMVIA